MSDPWNGKVLVTADDVTPEIEADIESCVEGWFLDQPMPTEDFIDKLCDSYGGSDYDLDQYDNEAARKIMRVARRIRKEARE